MYFIPRSRMIFSTILTKFKIKLTATDEGEHHLNFTYHGSAQR